jgi:hypothetical protein
VDPARVIGAAIGAVARILRRTGEDLVDAVRDAVTQAALPSAASLAIAQSANALPDHTRTRSE